MTFPGTETHVALPASQAHIIIGASKYTNVSDDLIISNVIKQTTPAGLWQSTKHWRGYIFEFSVFVDKMFS